MRRDKGNKELSLRQNIAWNTVGCLLNQGCIWAMTVVVVIFSHGYENSGVLAYAMALGNVFWPIATYNMRTIQVSDVKGEVASETYVGFRIITIGIACFVLTAYLLATTSSLALIIATLCWFVYKIDETFVVVYYAIDQKAMRMDIVGISQGIRGVLALGVFSLFILEGTNISIAIIAVDIAMICVTFAYDYPRAKRLAKVRPSITLREAVWLLKKYFPAVVATVFYISTTSLVRQIFEAIYGEEALGIYAAIAAPASLVPFLMQFLYSPLIGKLAQQWAGKDAKRFLASAAKVIVAIMAVSAVALMLGSWLGGPVLTGIYGGSIEDYVYLLIPTILSFTVTALFVFLLDTLLTIRSMSGVFASTAVAFGVAILLAPNMISLCFMNGINIAVGVGFSIGFLVQCLFLALKAKRCCSVLVDS